MKRLAAMIMTCAMSAAIFRTELRGEPSQAQNGFEVAYEAWQRALDKEGEIATEPFFFDKDVGSVGRRDAVKAVLAFGPEAVPALVTLMRNEDGRMRLYRAILLLQELASVNIYLSYKENIVAEVFDFRDEFLRQWDSGAYAIVDQILEKAARKYLRPNLEGEEIAARDLAAIRYYGIFAMPFLIRSIRVYDSPECYAAYLIITKQRDEYSHYIKHAKEYQITTVQKIENIRKWYANNREKIERVKDLGERIRKEAGL